MRKESGDSMSDLYKTIMELCSKREITGYRLCKDAGVQPSILTDLKMGRQKSLSAKNADKIASYFNVSVGYLLGNEDEKKPADQKADGLKGTGYELLTPENRDVIDSLIATLLKSQSGE